MTDKIQICFQCDGIIEERITHSCIRGLTDNINRLHHNSNGYIKGIEKSIERINIIIKSAQECYLRATDEFGHETNKAIINSLNIIIEDLNNIIKETK